MCAVCKFKLNSREDGMRKYSECLNSDKILTFNNFRSTEKATKVSLFFFFFFSSLSKGRENCSK